MSKNNIFKSKFVHEALDNIYQLTDAERTAPTRLEMKRPVELTLTKAQWLVLMEAAVHLAFENEEAVVGVYADGFMQECRDLSIQLAHLIGKPILKRK